jgi:hypothetical protein
MNETEKLYHWTNLILNPIILLLFFLSPYVPEGVAYTIMAWPLVSAVLNPRLRSWVIGAFATVAGGTAILGCMGSLVAISIFIVAVLAGAALGFALLLPALWFMSLMAVINDRRGLI